MSFILETDEGLLASKARDALSKCGVVAVVANLLETRHKEVRLFRAGGESSLFRGPEPGGEGASLETNLAQALIEIHAAGRK